MTSIWKLTCFPLMVCFALASSHGAAPTRPRDEASAPAKAAGMVKAKPKAKSPARPKGKVKAQTRMVKHPAWTGKSPPKAEKSDRPESLLPLGDQVALNESNLDAEAVAARRAVADNPGDIRARERLARIAVILVDGMLRAEAVGNTGRAGELTQKLNTHLFDTGWRVQKMAQSGDLMARQAAGFLLERGLLLAKDETKSCAEFFMAAEQLSAAGWHAAQCLMSISPNMAWMQMDRAAARGHATAQEWMGRRCLGEFGMTESDFTCARSWLAQSASQGRSRSQMLLAYLLMNGHGGLVDEPRAARLYKLAADQGDADAQNNLGEINEMGRGVTPNPEEALRWYERAAEHGLSSAQFNAGRLWAIGAGGKKDPARARALLLQAEGKGVAQAKDVLNWLDRQIPPAPTAASDRTPEAAVGVEKKD